MKTEFTLDYDSIEDKDLHGMLERMWASVLTGAHWRHVGDNGMADHWLDKAAKVRDEIYSRYKNAATTQ